MDPFKFFIVMFSICNVQYGYCTLYEINKIPTSTKSNILSEKKLPSKISCIHYCSIKHKDEKKNVISWYENGKCQCLLGTSSPGEEITIQHSFTKINTMCSIPSAVFEFNDTNQYCSCQSSNSGNLFCKELWTLINDNVCYEGKGNKFGEFQLPKKGVITSVKLQHVSGLIICNKNNSSLGSGIWTCTNDTNVLTTVITDDDQHIVYPPNITYSGITQSLSFGDKTAFTFTQDELIFKKPRLQVLKGLLLKVWNIKDLGGDIQDQNNSGRHCIKIFVKYT